jgi:CDP-glucose 4,6-dehydratase
VTVTELVQRILTAMGSNLKPEIRNEATNEIRAQHLSAAKAREMLDWRPLFDLDRGLALTIDWYRELLTHG